VRFAYACISIIVALAASAARADVSEATFTPQGRATYAPVKDEVVEVFVLKPDFKFRVIGVIEARGMATAETSILDQLDVIGKLLGNTPPQPGEKEDIALAMRALRQEAARAGALGVIILKSIQVRVTQNATERRIVAAAIRPE
jgi:hypothetical protein